MRSNPALIQRANLSLEETKRLDEVKGEEPAAHITNPVQVRFGCFVVVVVVAHSSLIAAHLTGEFLHLFLNAQFEHL